MKSDTEFEELDERVRNELEIIRDTTSARLALREEFYREYGHPQLPCGKGIGNSELSFIRWEIHRGVLNPLDDGEVPGSPWWREINFDFIHRSELAKTIHKEALTFNNLPLDVQFWLDYIECSTSENWYKAHNKAIVKGYIKYEHLAAQESIHEQRFMNEVLYRVLFAGAMCAGKEFGKLGKLLSNPRLPAVDILAHLPDFYPSHYPLSHKDIKHILHKGYSIEEEAVRIMDYWLIMPQLQSLYEWTADYLEVPEIKDYIYMHKPVYPKKRYRKR
jgi:hypothetical protein